MTNYPHCTAYFAISLDGFIADAEGGVGWLDAANEGLEGDTGYSDFIDSIDAILMGRTTFQQVLSFGAWPYTKPVYVLSNSLKSLPLELDGKASLACGSPNAVLRQMARLGHRRLYVDGGATVHAFLAEGLIDRLVMTMIPTLLGSGIRIFGHLPAPMDWTLRNNRTPSDRLVELTYDRQTGAIGA